MSSRKTLEVCNKFRHAVVRISCAFLLVRRDRSGSEEEVVHIFTNGVGSHIGSNQVVCPASLVMLPPSLTSTVIPVGASDNSEDEPGRMINRSFVATEIFCTFTGLVGDRVSYVKKAKVMGVSGAYDVALLSISDGSGWNEGTSCLSLGSNGCCEESDYKLRKPDYGERKCSFVGCNDRPKTYPSHPFIKLHIIKKARDELCVKEGDEAYLLGSKVGYNSGEQNFDSPTFCYEGVVSNPSFTEGSGWLLAEAISVSTSATPHTVGTPILNCHGEMLGMVTACLGESFTEDDTNLASGHLIGPNWRVIGRIVNWINDAAKCKGNQDTRDFRVLSRSSPGNSYFEVRHSYLGMAYAVVNGQELAQVRSYVSGESNLPLLLTNNGQPSNGPTIKEVRGLRVLGLSGANPEDDTNILDGYFYIPGGVSTAPLPLGSANIQPVNNVSQTIIASNISLPIGPSPLYSGVPGIPGVGVPGAVRPGDILLSIRIANSGQVFKIGNDACQVSLSSFLDSCSPGNIVDMKFLSGGRVEGDEIYDNSFDFSIALNEMSPIMSYPWYTVKSFPLISDYGITLNPLQLQEPQVPQLSAADVGVFHPAI